MNLLIYCTVPYHNLYDLYSVDQSGQVNIYVVQKNKWKHFENKYINKFQLTTIQKIPNHKLKILKADTRENIDLSPPPPQTCASSTAVPKFNFKNLPA
jgi:hypothetical protein